MSTNLVTKTEYKTYMGISSPNEDAKIDTLIAKISAFVKTMCRRSFIDNVDESLFQVFNGGSTEFSVKGYPVLSASVEYSTDYGSTYTTLVEGTDYVLNPDMGTFISINSNGFPYALRGYKVTYTYGFETLPEELKLAVFDLITYYRNNDSAIHSAKAPGTNSVQIEYIKTTSLPANIKRVLDLHVADYA